MADLSCGEPSELAWSIVVDAAYDFVKIPENIVGPMDRMLASGVESDAPVEAGETGVAGLCAVIAAAKQPALRQMGAP